MLIFQWLFLFSSIEATLIDEQRSNYLILAVEPYDSYAEGLVRRGVEASVGLTARLYVHHAASHGFRNKMCFLFISSAC